MAYQVDQACYETTVQAAEASVSKFNGMLMESGSSIYAMDVTAISQVSAGLANITWAGKNINNGATMSRVVSYHAQPCNLMTSSDALAMGWLVVAAWAAVYGVMFLTRALKGESGGDYGNA